MLNINLFIIILLKENMSGNPRNQKINNILLPNSNSKSLQKNMQQNLQSGRKLIQRKTQNNLASANDSKNGSREHAIPIQSPRFMLNSPIKLVPFTESVVKNAQITQSISQDLKTDRKDNLYERSIQKSLKPKKINDDSSEYYKYWKKKANQYQQLNFNLHRLNSALQQQNEILKHKFEKMQKKMLQFYQPEPQTTYDKSKNYEKLENYYRLKLDQMSKRIKQQQLLIGKKDKKIKQLSKYISQNYHLKNILDNMQQKISQMRSNCSRDSRTNSIDRQSDRAQKLPKNDPDLTIDYLQSPKINTALYGIREKKKTFTSYNPYENKPSSSRGY